MQNIRIADVTLTEAQNVPGMTLSFKEKLEIAKQIDKLGAAVIELPPVVNEISDAILIKSMASGIKSSVLAVPCAVDEKGSVTRTLDGRALPDTLIPADAVPAEHEVVCAVG